jgi:hypothetical protein
MIPARTAPKVRLAAAAGPGRSRLGSGRLGHRVRAALGPGRIGSGPHWVRAAWGPGRRPRGRPSPGRSRASAVRRPHPRRVRSHYAGCRGPDFLAGARDSGLRHLQNGFPLCSAVASQRDASGSGCGTDCQWKPSVQAGQQAMRLALFLLPIEQSRPRRSPRALAALVPAPVSGPAAGLADSPAGGRGCALT